MELAADQSLATGSIELQLGWRARTCVVTLGPALRKALNLAAILKFLIIFSLNLWFLKNFYYFIF